jgi:hypothetical protein
MSRRKSFKLGDTVVFDPSTFNPEHWDGLSEEDRLKYYGVLGYGRTRPHNYTFICEHSPQTGHCMLVSMEDQHIETMRHTGNFRLATEDEV